MVRKNIFTFQCENFLRDKIDEWIIEKVRLKLFRMQTAPIDINT